MKTKQQTFATLMKDFEYHYDLRTVFDDFLTLTTCAFSYFNLSMSNGHVMPSNNDNEKEYIGEKESSSEVSGNEKSGYIYSVMWFTSDEVKVLDCAQSEFTKNEINSVKKLAELIDGNQ